MNEPAAGPAKDADETTSIIKIAIMAVGGQGGGVLTGWITDLAMREGWHVQSTSVAGVAQRTGATIYFVEMARKDPERPDLTPVFALSPAPGDVDILVAAELAEAGRAVLRGFVTPDLTTLVASSHRVLAVSEKVVPGDGRKDAARVLELAGQAARRFVHFDMEAIARQAGSVISASLFGAISGAGVLPFARESFEETIRSAGRGAEASLAAFALAHAKAAGETHAAAPAPTNSNGSGERPEAAAVTGPQALLDEWQALEGRLATMPEKVAAMAALGMRKVVDFLDTRYGVEYLDRLATGLGGDDAQKDHLFSREAAKYLANAMVYDDIIRVADLKTRASRGQRVRAETGVAPRQTIRTTEYFHPRMRELAGLLSPRWGAFLDRRPWLMRSLDVVVGRGRRVRTDRIGGFGLLWLIAGMRARRRGLRRHEVETRHMEEWFSLALATRSVNYDLGVEVLRCRRLIKGYSDTHARGLSKFDRVLSALPLLEGREDGADWLRRLREAALADVDGEALDGALRTVHSFTIDETV